MTFGEAIEEVKKGEKVRRESWEEGTYIEIVPVIKMANGRTYVPLQKEVLAEDWELVGKEDEEPTEPVEPDESIENKEETK